MSSPFIINVSVVIFNNENKILLGLRSPHEDVFPGLWGIPGGKIDTSDKTIEDGLKREVKEEVDIEINSIKLISNNTRNANGKNILYLIFTAKIASGTPKAKEDTVKVQWFRFKDIDPEKLTPFTLDIVKQAISLPTP